MLYGFLMTSILFEYFTQVPYFYDTQTTNIDTLYDRTLPRHKYLREDFLQMEEEDPDNQTYAELMEMEALLSEFPHIPYDAV
jgi:N-acyl-D-aspartate/D-glutamate deacylase